MDGMTRRHLCPPGLSGYFKTWFWKGQYSCDSEMSDTPGSSLRNTFPLLVFNSANIYWVPVGPGIMLDAGEMEANKTKSYLKGF